MNDTKVKEDEPERLSILQPSQSGASFVKYSVLEKNGQKVLVPTRYSIRNQKQSQNLDVTVGTLMKSQYQPQELESLFSMNEQA
jgi:hypothetical protein